MATWAALRSYERKQFGFIVLITAKGRELTSSGIQALQPSLTSFEALLNNVLDVLGFPDAKAKATEEKEAAVRSLISESNGLLFVDNLETVDDARIIQFLDSLPFGVRALTTSRRTSVRVSVHPVTLGSLSAAHQVHWFPERRTIVRVCGRTIGLRARTCRSSLRRAAISDSVGIVPLQIPERSSRTSGENHRM